jgi:hypothetical protein
LVPPKDHTWTSSKINWVNVADGLPQHAQSRWAE